MTYIVISLLSLAITLCLTGDLHAAISAMVLGVGFGVYALLFTRN